MKRVLVVGDLHVGSNVGLMSEEVTVHGRTVGSIPIQEYLYNHWLEMVDKEGKVDAVLCMGDLVDGLMKKSNGIGVWTTDLEVQINEAAKLLSLIHTNKYLGVNGSSYHVGENLNCDDAVIKELGGQYGNELSIKVDKASLHASHAVGVSMSGTAYRPTPIAREMMMATINENEYGPFDLVLRGHAHYFVEVRFTHTKGVICPCWKGRDEYAARRTLAMLPRLGYVMLEIRGREVEVIPHTFTLPTRLIMKEVTV